MKIFTLILGGQEELRLKCKKITNGFSNPRNLSNNGFVKEY